MSGAEQEDVRVRRRLPRSVDIAVSALIVGAIAVIAIDPGSPARASAPVDTFTHVDVSVDDSGLHVTPATVPAGVVDVTVADNRADKSVPFSIQSVPPVSTPYTVGNRMVELRVVQTYAVRAVVAGRTVGNATLDITVPKLAAPREDAHVVTLDVTRNGVSTPRRESRYEQPVLPFTTNPPPSGRPWTSGAAGVTKVVIRNRAGAPQTCTVDGTQKTIDVARGGTGSVNVFLSSTETVEQSRSGAIFEATSQNTNVAVVTCTGGGASRAFALRAG